MERILPPQRVPFGIALAVTVAAPLIATTISLVLPEVAQLVPALLYLLSVVVASTLGRAWSGPTAALLSFLGLNFFFTAPRHTLRVDKTADLFALVVFLVVAAVVGALVDRSLRERSRAQEREREAALLNSLGAGLRSDTNLPDVLDALLRNLMTSFRLAGCAVDVAGDDRHPPFASARGGVAAGDAPRASMDLTAPGGLDGTLDVWRAPGGAAFSAEEERVFAALAGQIALAVERSRLDDDVREATMQQQATEARAALFSSVTHDLRTPLASIKAGVSSLLQPDAVYDDAQQRDVLETVLEETDRLDRLVGNILDLARGRAGALSPHRTPTSIEEVIESVLARMGSELAALHVRVMVRPDIPDAPLDPVQIDQVLTNLFENAARFAPSGSELLVTAAAVGTSIEVRVADRGPGIPPGERERVFEAFHRGDTSTGTTGLGLAIARSIIEAHGGRIWIDGSPGGGTAVTFRLPLGAT